MIYGLFFNQELLAALGLEVFTRSNLEQHGNES